MTTLIGPAQAADQIIAAKVVPGLPQPGGPFLMV